MLSGDTAGESDGIAVLADLPQQGQVVAQCVAFHLHIIEAADTPMESTMCHTLSTD